MVSQEDNNLTDKEWEKKYRPIINKIQAENLAKGIKPKSLFQILKERGQLQTFDELSSDVQGFLNGDNDDMLIASWSGNKRVV